MTAVAPQELLANGSVHSLRLLEEASVSGASESGPPVVPRRETKQILDYYQSAEADRVYVDPQRAYSQDGHAIRSEQELLSKSARSTVRPSSAEKDANASGGRTSMDSATSSTSGGTQRRTSQRSTGGGDKRRVAIIETDSQHDLHASPLRPQRSFTSDASYRLTSEHNLLARRGVDSSRFGDLALVAPPDAHLTDYTDLSPIPASAPPTGASPIASPSNLKTSINVHQRSMSDFQSRKRSGTKTSPRDVGIVGTMDTMQAIQPLPPTQVRPPHSEPCERGRPSTSGCDFPDGDHSLTAPVFQTPKSRSPSPLPAAGEPSSSQSIGGDQGLPTRGQTVESELQQTANLNQEMDPSHSVSGQVVMDLTPGLSVFRRSPNSLTNGLPIMEPPGEIHHSQRPAGRLPFKPNQAGPTYLHYQPGVHSTAGPLPSPPRHILTQVNTSPPPRPPRMLSPPPAARRTDQNVSKKSGKSVADGPKIVPIASRLVPPPVSRKDSDFSTAAVSVSSAGSDKSPEISRNASEERKPIRRPSGPRDVHDKPQTVTHRSGSHVREGAFPASSVFLSQPPRSIPSAHANIVDEVVATVEETTDMREPPELSDVSQSRVVEPPRVLKRNSGRPSLKREDSWVSVSAESTTGGHDDTSPPSSYSSSRNGSTHVSITNPVSDDGIIDGRRASLPAPPSDPPRRFHSLPRTPSLVFAQTSRTSAPSPQPAFPKKAPSSWPEAMNFTHVLMKRSAAERALGYAEKIQALASEVTGLEDWLLFNARKERRGTQHSILTTPSSLPRGFVKQSRHVSRNSMASEVTFPIRADSYTATDLSQKPTTDASSPNSPTSVLPYPSLAHGVGLRNHSSHNFVQSDSSSRGMSSPTSSSKTLGGAFFASLGRKSSMRKDRTLGPVSPAKLISSRKTAPIPQPRPVKIAAPPSLPGGPRAPARRGNSVIPLAAPAENLRSDAHVTSMPQRSPTEPTEAFHLQVERLSDLLPHADKEVLAIYLRRANNMDPMLAIGAYLEDEKQGSLLNE